MRTKHRRRFHTGRVIRNRQRRFQREARWLRPYHLEDGRLKHTNAYFDCGNSRCGLCHSAKFDEPRRTREKRAWRREWGLL